MTEQEDSSSVFTIKQVNLAMITSREQKTTHTPCTGTNNTYSQRAAAHYHISQDSRGHDGHLPSAEGSVFTEYRVSVRTLRLYANSLQSFRQGFTTENAMYMCFSRFRMW